MGLFNSKYKYKSTPIKRRANISENLERFIPECLALFYATEV